MSKAIAILAIMAGVWGFPGYGETLRLRSGEHDGFSRIALDNAAPSGWTLGRTKDGYELRLSHSDVFFDLANAFRAMPRTRIMDIAPARRGGALALSVGCVCHARAFATAEGTIVIDIRDGPPAADSPFEKYLDKPEPASTGPAGPLPPPYSDMPVLMVQPAIESNRMRLSNSPGPRHRLFPPSPPETTTKTAKTFVPHDVSERESLQGLPGETNLTSPAQFLPSLPDTRVAEAEAELLRQLSRAASQGLVEADIEPPIGTTHSHRKRDQSVAVPALPDPVASPISHIETSVDRDSLTGKRPVPVTANGLVCPVDADFALSAWGDDRPAAEQIADLRRPLVGEFDRPSTNAVTALARLYLFFGFGAESRAVLRAFSLDADANSRISDIAAILDGDIPGPPNSLAGMTDCDTAAALWAVLAHPDPGPSTTINHGAVIRAFSALPLHLRKALGPALSDRLLLNGATDAARAIRDAIARAPGPKGEILSMMDARISLARGDAAGGEALLDRVADTNDPASVEALILTIGSRLDRGEAISARLADNAAALAFELQDETMGPTLHRMHIFARASLRDYARAFAAYGRWVSTPPTAAQVETVRALWASLVEFADDTSFLDTFFQRRADLDQVNAEPELRLDIAARLVAMGFSEEARQTLGQEAADTERGKQILAAAALAEFDPLGAMAQIADLEGPENELVRAQALAMNGDHHGAATAFAAAGHPEDAGAEAWRAGDLRTASVSGPGPLRAALAAMGLAKTDLGGANPSISDFSENTDPPGTLAAARALVERSRQLRGALGTLLQVADAGSGQE